MKKNIFLRIAAVVIVTALFATCMLSGTTTLAKYASLSTGTATGSVASWAGITLNSADVSTGGASLTMDLFNAAAIDGHNPGDVQSLLAPGTFSKAAATLPVVNGSDVQIDIYMEIDTTTGGLAALMAKTAGFTFTGGSGKIVTPTVSIAAGASGVLDISNFAWTWDIDDTTSGDATLQALTNAGGYIDDTDVGMNAGTYAISCPVAVYVTQVD